MFPKNESYIYSVQDKNGGQIIVLSETADKADIKEIVPNDKKIDTKGESFINRIKNMFK